MKKVMNFVRSAGTKLSIVGLSVAAMTGTASAIDSATEIQPIPLFGGSFNQLVDNIITITLYVAGVLAIFYLIWGGISYVTAGGDAEKASKGRVAITNAIIGIIIIAASLAIYKFIIGDQLLGM